MAANRIEKFLYSAGFGHGLAQLVYIQTRFFIASFESTIKLPQISFFKTFTETLII